MDRLHVCVTGNPADGFTLYGPFDDATIANDWADEYMRATKYGLDDWWVMALNDPEEDEG